MKTLKPIVTTYELIELATKQGFEKIDINNSSATIAIMCKNLNKRLSINIYVSLTHSHEFEIFIRNFGTIRPFKNYYFKNIALFEKEAIQIYKNLINGKYRNKNRNIKF